MAAHSLLISIPFIFSFQQFVFEATRGQTYRDNIAIDDTQFYEGKDCPQGTYSREWFLNCWESKDYDQ